MTEHSKAISCIAKINHDPFQFFVLLPPVGTIFTTRMALIFCAFRISCKRRARIFALRKALLTDPLFFTDLSAN